MSGQDTHQYDDLLSLPHPASRRHPRMSRQDRAAQFAPFAALTGYHDAVQETARLTEEKIELSDGDKELLNRRLCLVQNCLGYNVEVTVTYFVADSRKAGGAYHTFCGVVKKVDASEKKLVFESGLCVAFDDLFELRSALFSEQEG